MASKKLMDVKREWAFKRRVVSSVHRELEEYVQTHPNWLKEARWKELKKAHDDALLALAEFERINASELKQLAMYRHPSDMQQPRPLLERPLFAFGIPAVVITFALFHLFGTLTAVVFGVVVILITILAVLFFKVQPTR